MQASAMKKNSAELMRENESWDGEFQYERQLYFWMMNEHQESYAGEREFRIKEAIQGLAKQGKIHL